ncbi:MAG TPA: hypothetical protein VFU92_02620 [Usitatibacter sp.]|nr:hypothetical protein [Usitatibacter sp.]
MQPEIARSARLVLAAALATAQAAAAIELGEARVRSSLGEPLDARIPFSVTAGESTDASCFALVRDPADGPGALGEGILTIERRRGEAALRVRTVAPVMSSSLTVRIRATCPGAPSSGTRQFTLDVAAQPGATPAPVALPAAAPLPAVVAQLRARPDDTLEAIAATVIPHQGEARRKYLAGLKQLNPSLADAPIAEGTQVALPDPRTIRVTRAETRVASAPRPPQEARPAAESTPPPRVARAPREPRAAPAKPPREIASPLPKAEATSPPALVPPEASSAAEKPTPPGKSTPAKAAAKAPRTAPANGAPFLLKLSSSEVDLSRSRNIDDRQRAQLRERLLILDADDQVAAMLSMRHSLRQLEARVADMQLKLDAMPASLARAAVAPKAEPPAPARIEPPKVGPPKVEPPKVEPPKVEAKVEPPKAVAKPEPPKVAAPPPVAKVEPPKVEPKAAAPAKAAQVADDSFSIPDWVWWIVAATLALLAIALAWRLRRSHTAESDESPAPARAAEVDGGTIKAAKPATPVDEPIEVAPEMARPQVGSDSVLATRLTDNAGELRRRYIEERFPEIQNRTIVLEDPASVVKGARLFYEDGALPRAVELLQFVIEERPQEVRPWLALFEIFRIERLTGEYAHLAERFREHHGKSAHWRKVQFFGREIDPGNALYREEPLNTLETIGPREARRLAAGLSSVGSTGTFDPIAENWLEAPMDFENEVLANELRLKLMAQASLTEQDLQPNPMPALRNIEMFTVA